jgi:integrase
VRKTILKVLHERGADLSDPESFKEILAVQKWVPKRKINAVDAYNIYCQLNGLEWDPPKYKDVEKIPYVPPEKYLDILITDTSPKTSIWLQCLKETGMRRGELHQVVWNDIDFMQGTIRCTSEKGSKPRLFKVSQNLINRLAWLKANNNVKDSKKIWDSNVHNIQRMYEI